jgi:hypothetical protein
MQKGISLMKVKKDVLSEIKKKEPSSKPKLTKVGLIDLLPDNVAENIKDNAKYGDALGGMLGGDDDPNSYRKAIKRAAIKYFKMMRGS